MPATTETVAPVPLPTLGEPVKVIIKRLITLFPKVSTNSKAEIDPDVWALYEYAKSAQAAWEQQVRLAEVKIRTAIGDAQFGTVNGVTVVKRHQVPVGAHHVQACTKDYIQASNG